jgi:uncharacterized protein (TIGR00661 family)
LVNGSNFTSAVHNPRILVAPLDWGLGHATRCIPIIKCLISDSCEVFIAASENNYDLLKKEFPSTVILRIKGYKIRYSRRKKWLPLVLFSQLPKTVFSILKENFLVKKMIRKYAINAVISDNRFGLFNKKIVSVYITHQLAIKTGNKFSEKLLQKLHYYFIKKYSYCWVPDYEQDGIGGELSHPKIKPSNVIYIGPLSRFHLQPATAKIYDILISISGPEPQRTVFENIILFQLKKTDKKILIVRGLPDATDRPLNDWKNVTIANHLSADELNIAFQQSEWIISRSGYTTIMDLIKLGKKAILVPTPGQTEQEYLAHYLMEKKMFYSLEQDKFSFDSVFSSISNFEFIKPSFDMNGYKKIVDEFVLSLQSGNLANR